jgi:hypothetical protein
MKTTSFWPRARGFTCTRWARRPATSSSPTPTRCDPARRGSRQGRGDGSISHLGSNFDENFWKSTVLDWYPKATAEDHVIAIAGSDGTGMPYSMVLISVAVTRVLRREREEGPLCYGKREFSARGPRACNALAFNPFAPNMLAGLILPPSSPLTNSGPGKGGQGAFAYFVGSDELSQQVCSCPSPIVLSPFCLHQPRRFQVSVVGHRPAPRC